MWINRLQLCSKVQNCKSKILELAILLGLIIVTGFFVKDVWNKYESRATSIKARFVVEDLLDLPVIVICFNPPFKQYVLEKYRASNHDIMKSNLTVYQEGIFKIERDFTITFSSTSESFNQDDVKIKELYTFYHALCYRILANFKMEPMERFLININISKEHQNVTNMSFYFTSEQNSLNVIDDKVVGNILHFQTKAIGLHTVMLQKSIYKKLQATSSCNGDNIIPMECASKG